MEIMLFFPLLYFSFIFICNYRKRGIDIYSFLILIYTICAFFSIFVDALNLYKDYDIFKHPLGIIAPFSYCVLLSICMLPFKRFNSNLITDIEIVNIKHYNVVVYAFFSLFILMVLVSTTKISDIIQAQSMAALRDDFYHGNAEFVWSGYSGWFRYFIAISSLLSGSSQILILFFFYNITILKKSLLFNAITLLGSLTPLIQSLFIADRSGFIYWLLIFSMSYVLFKNIMTTQAKKKISVFALFVILLVISYFAIVTISRFGEDTGGNYQDIYGSLVYYAGSNYIQYCNFFNTLPLESPFSLAPVLPLTYWILGLPSYFEQCQLVETYYHHGVSNFSTFLGLILSMSGRVFMCIFVCLYYRISKSITSRNNMSKLSIKKLVYFFIVVLVVNNGLFGYFYMSYSSTCNIIIWIILASYLSNKTRSVKL